MSIYALLFLTLFNGSGARASRVLLALFALDFGAGPLTVGLIVATFSVCPMLFSVTAGKLADRFGSRWLLLAGGVISVLGMVAPYFFPGLPAIFIASAISGLSDAIYSVAVQNAVGLLSKADTRAQNFGNLAMVRSVANFIGPLIAGVSIDAYGYGIACLIVALVNVVPVVILMFWGSVLPGGNVRAQKVPQASGGILAILADSGVRRLLIVNSLLQAGRDLYQFYTPVYGHAIGLSASTIGVVLAMNFAASFVIRMLLPKLVAKYTEVQLLFYAFFIGAGALLLMPLFTSAIMLSVMSFIFGLGMGACEPIVTILMFTNSTEGRSGEALGLRMSTTHFTKLIVPVAFGAVGSVFNAYAVFWTIGFMLCAGGTLSRSKMNGGNPQ
jgi:MFS family permease